MSAQRPGAPALEAGFEVHPVPDRQSGRHEVLWPVRGVIGVRVPVVRSCQPSGKPVLRPVRRTTRRISADGFRCHRALYTSGPRSAANCSDHGYAARRNEAGQRVVLRHR